MARLSTITHKGVDILYIEYKGLNETEMIETLYESEQIALKSDKPILILSNMLGAFMTPKFNTATREVGKRSKEKLKHLALVMDASPAKRILMNSYMRIVGENVKVTNSLEGAKDFLASV